MESLRIGELSITWLNGGNNHLDGGAMFGVVPKPLWSKKYPVNEKNQIPLRTDPLLIQKDQLNILIDSGMGNGRLNEKQIRNLGVTEESSIDDSLSDLGLSRHDIHYVLMTHLHADHACGLTVIEDGELRPAFPNAKYLVSEIEWEEMRKPNIRSKSTYWKENWEGIIDLVQPFHKEIQVTAEIKMVHSGGHSHGHSVILFESKGEKGIHFGDLMPTHAHQNPLWVLAYDDYPMDSIFFKEQWVKRALEEKWWLTFYHDSIYRAIKWNTEGVILDSIKRQT